MPSTAVLLGVPGPAGAEPRMLLVHDNRTAALHDLATGALLASARAAGRRLRPGQPGRLRRPACCCGTRRRPAAMVSAYDPVTLQQRWTRPAGYAFGVTACGRLTCLTGPDGVRAVDPADRRRALVPARLAQRRAARAAWCSPTAPRPGTNDPVGVVDPATGEVLVDLQGWRLGPGDGGDQLLVTRVVDAGARTMVAVADPGDATAPARWPSLPAGTGDCQSVPERLVCRSTSGELTGLGVPARGLSRGADRAESRRPRMLGCRRTPARVPVSPRRAGAGRPAGPRARRRGARHLRDLAARRPASR